jgi:hypothetical protein
VSPSASIAELAAVIAKAFHANATCFDGPHGIVSPSARRLALSRASHGCRPSETPGISCAASGRAARRKRTNSALAPETMVQDEVRTDWARRAFSTICSWGWALSI